MINWYRPTLLLLLLLIPPLAWAAYRQWQWQQAAIRRLGNVAWRQKLVPQRRGWLTTSWLLATALSIAALADPRWGQTRQQVETNNLQLMILLDVSQSMLAEDAPGSRLVQAKEIVNTTVTSLEAGDQVGLIAFAGETRLLLPLTSAKSQLTTLLSPLYPTDFATQGTLLAPALATAVQSFPYPRAGQPIIFILSDGEEHGGNSIEVAQAVAADDVLIVTVGMGTPAGANIPVKNEASGEIGLKLDSSGEPVLSRINEAFLQQVALVGNGRYLSGSEVVTALPTYLQAIRQTHSGSQIVVEPRLYYQLFLSVALLFLCLNWLPPIKPNKVVRLGTSGGGSLLLIGLITACQSSDLSTKIAQGNEAFAQAQYSQASTHYAQAAEEAPQAAVPAFNLANVHYRLEQYPEAVSLLQELPLENSPDLLPDAYFNLGNSYFQMADYAAAIVAYQAVLRLQPNDAAAKYNLELAIQAAQGGQSAADIMSNELPLPAEPAQSNTSFNSDPELLPVDSSYNNNPEQNENAAETVFRSLREAAFLPIPLENTPLPNSDQPVVKDW